jgi:hypothetical protein
MTAGLGCGCRLRHGGFSSGVVGQLKFLVLFIETCYQLAAVFGCIINLVDDVLNLAYSIK